MNLLRGVVVVMLAVLAGGCTTILSETNDRPIEEDPGRRSVGTMLDDDSIETTAAVNIDKTDPLLESAHIVAVSFNGNVLLTGQVPNEDLRARAAQVAASVKNVKSVRNELTVGANSSFAARSADTLITAKVKSKLLTAANIKDSRVKVVTENGVVFLLGLVTRAEADIAGRTAQDTDGVQKVVLLFEYVD